MPCTVRNLIRRMVTYQLPHEVGGFDRVRVGTAPLDASGVRGLRVETRRLGRSITLMAAGSDGSSLTSVELAARGIDSDALRIELKAADGREIEFIEEQPADAKATQADASAKSAPADDRSAPSTTRKRPVSTGGEG